MPDARSKFATVALGFFHVYRTLQRVEFAQGALQKGSTRHRFAKGVLALEVAILFTLDHPARALSKASRKTSSPLPFFRISAATIALKSVS